MSHYAKMRLENAALWEVIKLLTLEELEELKRRKQERPNEGLGAATIEILDNAISAKKGIV